MIASYLIKAVSLTRAMGFRWSSTYLKPGIWAGWRWFETFTVIKSCYFGPDRVKWLSKGEGTGRYVILELDTNFAGNELAVKQTAALRTDCVITAPTTRLYSAEVDHK